MSCQQPRPVPACGDHIDHERALWVSERVCKLTVLTPPLFNKKTHSPSNTLRHIGTQQLGGPRVSGLVHSVCVSGSRETPNLKANSHLLQHDMTVIAFSSSNLPLVAQSRNFGQVRNSEGHVPIQGLQPLEDAVYVIYGGISKRLHKLLVNGMVAGSWLHCLGYLYVCKKLCVVPLSISCHSTAVYQIMTLKSPQKILSAYGGHVEKSLVLNWCTKNLGIQKALKDKYIVSFWNRQRKILEVPSGGAFNPGQAL